MRKRSFLFLLLFQLFALNLRSQDNLLDASFFIDGIEQKKIIGIDSWSYELEKKRVMDKFIFNGYLMASIDSVIAFNPIMKVYIHKGQKVSKVRVNQIDLPEDMATNFKSLLKLRLKSKSLSAFNSQVMKGLNWMANHGYPFALLTVEKLNLKGGLITCNIKIDKGPLIVYDSVFLFGKVKLSKGFIRHYLGINNGDYYSEKVVANLRARIGVLNYLELTQDPLVMFRKNKASLILRLKETEASSINALVGLAPESDNNGKKLLLTGLADIALVNLAGNREEINLNWQSFLRNSQSLKAGLYLPFLPYINLGTDLNFSLVKYDSNYLQTQGKFALTFLSASNLKWSIFYQSDVTSLLTADTFGIRANFNFPTINATNIKSYGIRIEKRKWSDAFNPWKGYHISVQGSAGTKRIVKDNRIEQVVFNQNGENITLYDTLQLDFNQYSLSSDIRIITPIIGQKYVLQTHLRSGFNLADKLFFTDLERLGGFKTFKGFDEQSIFANQFVALSAEFRYRFNQLSNAFLFSNVMYYKNEAVNFQGNKEDIPIGFGVGANINTGNTVLSMAYGYGIQKNIPLNINQGKFHFGLVSYF